MKKSLLYTLCAICLFSLSSCRRNSFKSEDQIVQITLTEDGEEYSVPAVGGQVIVMFDSSVSKKEARSILADNGAKIISTMPDVFYYLVEVDVGKESELVEKLHTYSEVAYVYPNAIQETKSVISIAIDDYYPDSLGYTHGKMVVSQMSGDDPKKERSIKKYNIGIPNSKYVDTHKANEFLRKILYNLPEGKSAVINLSIGVGLYNKNGKNKRVLWDDDDVGWLQHYSYNSRYVAELEGLVQLVRPYRYKDFVITKSAGNEGVKDLERLVKRLRWTIPVDDWNMVFERHFILVTAQDDNKEGDYPNDVSSGGYDPMVTKVNLSDKTAQDLHWQGTSYAAPRLANYIIRASDKYDINVTGTLKVLRDVTKDAPGHLITYELLDDALKEYLDYEEDEDEEEDDEDNGPEQVAREFFIASACGDMATIRACATPDIYEEAMQEYQELKHQLTPSNRARAEQAYRNIDVQTIEIAENKVVVKLNNNGRRLSYYLSYSNGQWLIYDYAVGNMHVPKNMRRRR